MASLAALSGFDASAPPPALLLGGIEGAAGEAISDQAFSEGRLAENMPHDLSQIVQRRAGRGVGRHSGAGQQIGRAIQLGNQEVTQGRYNLTKTLGRLAYDRFMVAGGLPLGHNF